MPEPTSYVIRAADLWREDPGDICRTRDAAFLDALLDRVRDRLPVDQAGNLEFVDFTVPRDQLALLRVRRGDGTMMVAGGAFDGETCTVGDLAIAEGTTALALD
ncbi:hypothetical protein [Qipengyuania citrea]|uniref:hypothetical protein n=1 Tax=Qipengyuania citrea TaxID=225971 RepID=UPI00209CA9F4|nr:hypothetical protein [Qipengyuania citrea]MCP2016856.1 hypothetical protein [Qipengyuania citrea]